MSIFETAVLSDVDGDYVKASEFYEKSIESEAFADAFINLSVLYFQFTDYGINADLNLPVDFVHKAFDRYDPVISAGISRFPENTEMRFWKRYFSDWTVLTESEVLRILEEGNPSNVPFFFLYLLNPRRYQKQRDNLLAEIKSLRTAKNKWILSLIEDEPV